MTTHNIDCATFPSFCASAKLLADARAMEMAMTWAAKAERVPPNWTERYQFDPEQGDTPTWTEECTHWQFWQTKADVTPVSPIFASSDEMADFAISNLSLPWFKWGANLTRSEWIEAVERDAAT